MIIKFYNGQKTTFAHLIKFKQEKFDGLTEPISNISHVEVVFDDEMMFGASEYDGGVRSKHMPEFKDHWLSVDLNLTNKEKTFCRGYMQAKLGLRYDRVGIVFAQGLKTEWFLQEDKFFCSELIIDMLQELMRSDFCGFTTMKKLKAIIGKTPHMVTPGENYLLLTNPKLIQ